MQEKEITLIKPLSVQHLTVIIMRRVAIWLRSTVVEVLWLFYAAFNTHEEIKMILPFVA